MSGAVISLFGKGLQGGSLITLSDSAGRFSLASLPPGSYTLRALGTGRLAAPARQVTVLPNRDAVFSVSLSAQDATLEDAAGEDERPAASREWRWLLRHKRRSVLEARDADTTAAGAEASLLGGDRDFWVPAFAGSFELMTEAPSAFGRDGLVSDGYTPNSSGAVRLHGRIADAGRWSLGGLMTETDNTTWRMAAEFVLEPVAGHEIEVGTGYGNQYLRPFLPGGSDAGGEGRSTGAIFVRDRWENDYATFSGSARYSFIGFVSSRNHVDPAGSLEVRPTPHTHVRASAAGRTLVPGGDLLTLSTLASAPAIAYARIDRRLEPEKTWRYELAVDQEVGATSVGFRTFHENVDRQLVNSFDGERSLRSLRIMNGSGLSARGIGVSVGHRFGSVARGSVSYTFGQSQRDAVSPELGAYFAFRDAEFHDIVTRFETVIDCTDTRLSALYRVHSLTPVVGGKRANESHTGTRFDVQLTQGLPFLGGVTRANWELLVAFRNLFYEAAEGGTLDEMAVQNPPTRVLGGISVKF